MHDSSPRLTLATNLPDQPAHVGWLAFAWGFGGLVFLLLSLS